VLNSCYSCHLPATTPISLLPLLHVSLYLYPHMICAICNTLFRTCLTIFVEFNLSRLFIYLSIYVQFLSCFTMYHYPDTYLYIHTCLQVTSGVSFIHATTEYFAICIAFTHLLYLIRLLIPGYLAHKFPAACPHTNLPHSAICHNICF